jgi:hypothetical protein
MQALKRKVKEEEAKKQQETLGKLPEETPVQKPVTTQEDNGILGAIGRAVGGTMDWLSKNPIKATYSPGVTGAEGTKPGTFGFDTQPLVESGQREALLKKWSGKKAESSWENKQTGEKYEVPKGYTWSNMANPNAKPTAWSFNKNASPAAQEYRAKLKAALRINPQAAKSEKVVQEIMGSDQFTSNEKYELLRTLDPALLQLMIEKGMAGGD